MRTVWHRLVAGEAPWGDYGHMLVTGMAARESDGTVAIERVGTFVPPIAIAALSDIMIVTDEFRGRLESSGLTGFSFAEARKKRIVRLDWRNWDVSAAEPRAYPAGGEPEGYILGRKHDAALADEIGPIWEVRVDEDAEDSVGDIARERRWPQPIVVSNRAKNWLEAEAREWVRLEPLL
jgi:hypothetical protein